MKGIHYRLAWDVMQLKKRAISKIKHTKLNLFKYSAAQISGRHFFITKRNVTKLIQITMCIVILLYYIRI